MRKGSAQLLGRRAERDVLDRLLEAVRTGNSRALVVRGEPGAGKTALLEYLAGRAAAAGCRVATAAGVQSEMELAFAAVHQLCAPMLDRLERLPVPQRDALRATFGLSAGRAPDRFLVGLAVLGLLSETAAARPLVCLIDDAQWLDRASAQVLTFVARRLGAESVALVFAARVPADDLAGLPELVVGGLEEQDARALLDSVLTGPLDARVRDQIVVETRGNPLALLELPRGLAAAELAGGFGLPGALPLPERIEESFRRRVNALPDHARRLLLLAAAEPTGDPALMWRAAGQLGIDASAAQPAAEAGLVEFGARVRFRHPLVRSAVYRSASAREKQKVHRALAEATDPAIDPDRHAWHRAQAAPGPDEDVAAELERSAGRAQARGGLAAAAAFLARATVLTPDLAQRAGRALAAAQAKAQAGASDAALNLLAMAEAGPLSELQRARIDLVRGQIAFASTAGSDAPALLLKAAKRLESLDATLARQTYLDAWQAAVFAGPFAGASDLHEVSRAARSAPPPAGPPRPPDLLLDGLAVLVTEGRAEAAPLLRRAVRVFAEDEITIEERLRWAARAAVPAAAMVWDEERWHTIVTRELQSCRDAGLLAHLTLSVNMAAFLEIMHGDFAAAASLIAEAEAIAAATGTHFPPVAAVALAGFRGAETEAAPLIDAVSTGARAAGQGNAVQMSQWVSAILFNGLGRYKEALAAAQQAAEQAPELHVCMWALPELIEAASRTGQTRLAVGALDRLAEATSIGQTDWGQGIYARSRALLSDGQDAERGYREAIDRLGRTRLRPQLARAHLLYGEWLRRERRRTDAREQLRTAHGMLEAIGMKGFAGRARRELRAAGDTARTRATATSVELELTAQEAQIARLARNGLSNPEIGTRLFLSPHTVQYHLRHVFTKLGITSRTQLSRVLPSS